ncbi:unnamed protein product, partial [Prorocentrum cordatum]
GQVRQGGAGSRGKRVLEPCRFPEFVLGVPEGRGGPRGRPKQGKIEDPLPPGPFRPCWQVSPALHGAATPVQQAFCYAVPLPQGLASPAGAPWRAMGPILHAVPIGGAHMVGSGASSAMSPLSDVSLQERLLPRRLCSSDPDSSHASLVSDTVHPESRSDADLVTGAVAGAAIAAPSRGGPDECWVCIPSGIVERNKAQFEGRAGGDTAVEA